MSRVTRFAARDPGPAARLVGFMAHLRTHGFRLGVAETETALRALDAAGAVQPHAVRMALKAVQLSKERCESVRKAMLGQHNVDAARIESVGCGWNEPAGTDGEQNRRVEVQWFTIE